MNHLKIASCQFPVSDDIELNAKYIQKLIRRSALHGANLIHFSECALSGYAGVDFDSWENFNWDTLQNELEIIKRLAKNLRVWVVLGSSYIATKDEKPRNCLHIISDKGEIIQRYDKRMLTVNDTHFYSAGPLDGITTIEINYCKIGFIICYDSCFPEMFQQYYKKGVQVLLVSLYNARNKDKNFLDEVTPSILRTRAIDYHAWILANNSSAPYSNWPSCIISPDGMIKEKLQRHQQGVLYHIFPDDNYKKWRVRN